MSDQELRLCRLTAQNVLRLKCVDLEFDGAGAVIIGGRNAQGKSSALSAIWYALGGKKMHAKRPVRDGEEEASVRLDLGKYIVERRWTDGGEKTELRLTGADGGVFKRAQELLDTFFEDMGVDPLEFMRCDAKLQAQIVLATLPVDIAALDSERERVYMERRDVNRDLERRKGALTQMPSAAGAPTTEVGVGKIASDLSDAETRNRANDALRAERNRADERLRDAHAALERAEAEFVRARDAATAAQEAADSAVDVDTTDMRTALEQAEVVNVRFRSAQRRREVEAEVAELAAKSEALTGRLGAIDAEKAQAITDADLGVEGLGFASGELTFNGLPLCQASSAEQLRVSLAISLRLNPELKLVTISDGSLLDEENLQVVREMAEAAGALVLIERVGAGPEVQVVIEDGEVAEVRG